MSVCLLHDNALDAQNMNVQDISSARHMMAEKQSGYSHKHPDSKTCLIMRHLAM